MKNPHWGDLVRGLFEAYDRNSWLAIMTDANGLVAEGAGFNVFALVDGVLVTPARGVLLGITRRTGIEICEEAGIAVSIGDLASADVYRASEIFVSSTAGGVMPVRTLDVSRSVREASGP